MNNFSELKYRFNYASPTLQLIFINAGVFQLRYIDIKTAELKQLTLKEGDTHTMPPLTPHQSNFYQKTIELFLQAVYRSLHKI